MKTNSDKSHPLLISESDEDITASINTDITSNSKLEKPLDVKTDYKLTLDKHVSRICNRASQKLSALARILSFMKPSQKRQSIH